MKKYFKKFLAYKMLRDIIFYLRHILHGPPPLIISIFETIKEHYSERKLDIQTSGSYSYRDIFSSCKDAEAYEAIPYHMLENIAFYLKPGPEDVFIDLGSGKGRAVFFMALYGMKKMLGIELNEDLINISRENLNNFRFNKASIEFIQADAAGYRIKDENIFFMFNPFGRRTLQAVINNIKNSLAVNPRRIRIVYYSPAHRDILDADDLFIREGELNNGNCLIWRDKGV